MSASRLVFIAIAAATLAAVATGAWWLGLRQGQSNMNHAAASASGAGERAPVARSDPANWTTAQGEEATRRHIRDGIKAGDIDPVTGRKVLHYADPMVPGKTFEAPGKSPFMDMMLVPRYAGIAGSGETDGSSVSVSARVQQNLGLRTALVEEASLAPELAAVGSVVWNERAQQLLTSRAMAFVEKLHVRAALDAVAAGAPLAEVYVPEWVAAQEDYLALARRPGRDTAPLLEAAHQRMRQVGMDEDQVDKVITSGKLQPRFTLVAPFAGIVSELMAREGATVMPGMPIMRVQGTATVWAEGQVPESQAALLKPGMRVSATSPGLPGQRFEGRVQALLPEVDAATRTLKVRMELANPGRALVPGLFVQMRFAPPAAARALVVPSDAVIQTGRRSVVMLAEEGGHYRPVEVLTGAESGDRVEVRRGLKAGQRVVISGQFLIDSEASLRGLEARLNEEPASAAAVHRTEAVVDAIEADTISLSHPEIAALKWPAMTMDFKLPPRAQRPPGLAAGDKVVIEFRQQQGDVPLITKLTRTGAGTTTAAAASGPASGGRR